MPIEFKCSQCGRLLRTGDETAGRLAQCPQCGSQTQIPQPSQPPATPPADEIPTLQADDSPFGGSGNIPPLGGSPFNSQTGSGPYQQSWQAGSQYNAENAGYAKSRVSGPAIGLIVTAALGLLGNIAGLSFTLLAPAAMQAPAFPNNPANANAPQMPNFLVQQQFGVGFTLVQYAIGLGLAILVLVGGIKMNKLENYALAMTASIVAIIPCFSPCCLVGIPIGIWALVVLNDANVKSAFR